MPETTPLEKLQPCLLDRLTDDEPGKREESRLQRVMSHQRYRRGVLRDLEWLLNTQAYLSADQPGMVLLTDYPEVFRSVLNFGVRQFCGSTAPDLDRLQEQLGDVLRVFEPRITAHSLIIRADHSRNRLTFEVKGELWANPLPDQLNVQTTVDLETGQCMLGDALHG